MTLDRAVAAPANSLPAKEDATDKADDSSLEVRLLQIVRDDPFSSIRDIRNALRYRSKSETIGWFGVFDMLRRKGLLTKRSRFRMLRS